MTQFLHRMMDRRPLWLLPVLFSLLFPVMRAEDDAVKQALVQFMEKLSAGSVQRDPNWGWNTTSDPCNDQWLGVKCDLRLNSVRNIVLEDLNLPGTFDASSVCMTGGLAVLSLQGNNVVGLMPEEIGNCRRLTHLYLSRNQLSGNLPDTLLKLRNLRRLEISNNQFSGALPDLSRISGLISFVAENNRFSGAIPNFDFTNLQRFNVSNNNLSGPIPDVKDQFTADSFLGNPELCGKPLSSACPLMPPSPSRRKSKDRTSRFLIYSGYIILGLVLVLFFALRLVRKTKPEKENTEVAKEGVTTDHTSSSKPGGNSSEFKATGNRSEYSITSVENGMTSSSLVVLTSPTAKGLKFEDLLRAPAELLDRGKHGSLYKVMLDDGKTLAVKRIKEWGISRDDFNRRMKKVDQVKHPNVLPTFAFYSSTQEKLLVYEYQANGSLFKLLHGSQNGQTFDWGSRLNVASDIAKALAFMHDHLSENGIAHGNLKSTNILFNKNMSPCISEYGLMVVENQDQSFISHSSSFKNNDLSVGRAYSTFKVDVYGFGVILLELLTGKLVQNSGFNLARWVHSMVREEWTCEVFDKALISEGASEERMVNLLQAALRCINPSPHERPTMYQIAVMINQIKEEEDRSTSSET